MSYRSVVFLVLFINLMVVSGQLNTDEETIDLDTNTVTIKWLKFCLIICGNQTTVRAVLLDESCLMNRTLHFNNASCLTATTERPRHISDSFQCPDENFIGINCDIPNNPCSNPELCLNGGKCISDSTLEKEYVCQCPEDYLGENCENDNRICKNNTCWHDGTCKEMQQIVSLVNETTFHCDCKAGYDGVRCESKENMCENISCANNAVCFSSYPTWTCVCLDSSLYSGIYCEKKSSALIVRQVLSKSFASIAITAIILVFLFVIVMDVLKYGFKIDPIDRERQLMLLEDEKKQKKKNKRTKSTNKQRLFKSYHIS